MNDSDFDLDLEELSSAEDFLNYFGIAYDPAVVQVNRLHILQRFHDYLAQHAMPEDQARNTGVADKRALYAHWLEQAYQDFVSSDALTEKVFKVFQMGQPSVVNIPLESLTRCPELAEGRRA